MAPLPDHPIERCKADVGLIAYLIVSKFADHLPLYRQNGISGPGRGGYPPGHPDQLGSPNL